MLSRAGYRSARPDDDPKVNWTSGQGLPEPFAVPEHLTVVDSTNRHLTSLALAGLPDGSEVPEGYSVVAESQTGGRGRRGRRWHAPLGSSVLCSILFRPALDPDQLHLVAWAVALAALQACKEVAGVDLGLKWPNDLLARGGQGAQPSTEKKVAGILSEVLPAGQLDDPFGGRLRPRQAVVVGIGINVNWPPDWPPSDSGDTDLASVAASATSLNRTAGREIDRAALVGRMLHVAGIWNAKLAGEEGRRALASEYRRLSATIGRDVRVELAGETVAGRALDVDDAGCLVVSTGSGVRAIAAGDVVHLR